MVMSNTPFISALDDQHSEARWGRHRIAILHPGKLVKAGDHYGVVTEPLVRHVAQEVAERLAAEAVGAK